MGTSAHVGETGPIDGNTTQAVLDTVALWCLPGRHQCWGCSRCGLPEQKIFASARLTSGTSAHPPRLVGEAGGALDEAPAVFPGSRAAC
jgi:hypothetical protein